ncbi:hypothetical protein BDZ89DRAFT_1145524 [Hymenopellis radicata]|nr:hypothetical protein BDZ89DRAFT_1145524 [Hymenopellis radicata]
MKPKNEADPVKTIVTTYSHDIDSPRHPLHLRIARTSSTRSDGPAIVSRTPHTYTLHDIRSKRESDWSQNSVKDYKGVLPIDGSQP